MSERTSGQATSQNARPARGPDRCDKCKAQHARCDGARPVCRRCHRSGSTCVYAPKRSPWTVYTDANRDSRGQTSVTSSAPGSYAKSLPNAIVDSGSVMLGTASNLPAIQRALGRGVNVPSSDPLHSSLDAAPSPSDWSEIRVDVHALMNNFFQIDARYVPGGYLKEIVSSMDLTVSYTSLPALYQSILKRKFETDPAVLNVRGCVLRYINRALRESTRQTDDSTIISIKHQLYYDCFISSKPVILAHLNGLHQIVRIRGGLHTLGLDGDLAHMLKVHVLMAYIIIEQPPPNEYLQYRTSFSNAVETITPGNLDYSPLLPLSGDEAPPAIDDNPRDAFCQLIFLLQQMTDSFLNPGPFADERHEQLYLDILNSSISYLNQSDSTMLRIYEACHLAGIIFAAAIRYCVPLSSAALRAANDSKDVSLIENLYRAIYRSPYSSQPFWGEWAGCFLWVSLVSASLGLCGPHVESPPDDLYWNAKLRQTSLVVPFSFATKLFHAKTSSNQAFLLTEIMIRIQGKLTKDFNNREVP